MGALSATHKKAYREGFGPLVPGFSFVPFNNAAKLRAAVGGETAAVVIEPVQGEGGIRPGSAEFLGAAREVCDETGALLVFDEIQTGFCRTGRMFACERHGVFPDVLCLAKAIAGGVPTGAVLANDRIQLPPGKHGTTFGGNPLASAAALAAIEFMQEARLAERAEALGARFRERFEPRMPKRVRALRQVGLMIGMGAEGALPAPHRCARGGGCADAPGRHDRDPVAAAAGDHRSGDRRGGGGAVAGAGVRCAARSLVRGATLGGGTLGELLRATRRERSFGSRACAPVKDSGQRATCICRKQVVAT